MDSVILFLGKIRIGILKAMAYAPLINLYIPYLPIFTDLI